MAVPEPAASYNPSAEEHGQAAKKLASQILEHQQRDRDALKAPRPVATHLLREVGESSGESDSEHDSDSDAGAGEGSGGARSDRERTKASGPQSAVRSSTHARTDAHTHSA